MDETIRRGKGGGWRGGRKRVNERWRKKGENCGQKGGGEGGESPEGGRVEEEKARAVGGGGEGGGWGRGWGGGKRGVWK